MKPIPFDEWKQNNPDIESGKCEVCHGGKWITCLYCRGSGDSDPLDYTSEDERCCHCDGEGSIVCYGCNGDGTTLYSVYKNQIKEDLQFLDKHKMVMEKTT